MRRDDEPATSFDPMAIATASLNLWRLTTFDIPFAFAQHVSDCARGTYALQVDLMVRLADARCAEDVAAAQADMVEAAIDDYERNAALLARDVAVTLQTARAG